MGILSRDENGRFIKGNVGFWNGKQRDLKTNKKISVTLKGKFSAEKHPNWRGGKFKRKDGYIEIYCPKHPRAKNRKYVMEHILVMERFLGRKVNFNESIHHINKKRDDNRLENLKLFSLSEHSKIHSRKSNYQNYEIKKDWLYKQYVIKQKSAREIAKELKISYSTIVERLRFFKIPVRGVSRIYGKHYS